MKLDLSISFLKPLIVRNEFISAETVTQIHQQLAILIMKLSELPALLSTVNTKLDEAKTEILAEIAKLKASDPDISPEGLAALDALSARASSLGDIAPPVTPVTPE